MPGAQGKIIHMLCVTFLFGDVSCDFSSVKYVLWLQRFSETLPYETLKLTSVCEEVSPFSTEKGE